MHRFDPAKELYLFDDTLTNHFRSETDNDDDTGSDGSYAFLKGRLENDPFGRRRVIQARNVDRSKSSPNGRNCNEDQAQPI